MTNQKLISALQSRIAKRRKDIYTLWYMSVDTHPEDREMFKSYAIFEGVKQKEDKLIMKALIEAENSLQYIKKLKKYNEGMFAYLVSKQQGEDGCRRKFWMAGEEIYKNSIFELNKADNYRESMRLSGMIDKEKL